MVVGRQPHLFYSLSPRITATQEPWLHTYSGLGMDKCVALTEGAGVGQHEE